MLDSFSKKDLKEYYKNELKNLIEKKAFTKNNVLALIVNLRQFSDITEDFSPVLKFFCDWSLHTKKDRHLDYSKGRKKNEVTEITNRVFNAFLRITLFQKKNVKKINNHVRFLALIEPFMYDLFSFLKKEGIASERIEKHYLLFTHRLGELISFKTVFISDELALQISPKKGCTCFEVVFYIICNNCSGNGIKLPREFK